MVKGEKKERERQIALDEALVAAAKGDAAHEVARLLSLGANPRASWDPRDRKLPDASFALRAASYHGAASCVALLIPVSDVDTDEGWPFVLAVANGHRECARLLAPATTSLKGYAIAVEDAICKGDHELADIALGSCPKSLWDSARWLAIMEAAGSVSGATQAMRAVVLAHCEKAAMQEEIQSGWSGSGRRFSL